MKKIRALSVGAVLWDVINEREYIGGAPFNVAVNLKRLGAESAFVTCVGRDARGDRALEKIREYGVHSFAQRDERFATGVAEAVLDETGSATYRIPRAAFDEIQIGKEDLAALNAYAPDLVCFGSFEQRFPRSRASVQSILQNVKADCVFFDVNIRMDFAEKEVIGFSLQACDVLKLNEDECALLGKLLYGKDLCVRSFCRRVAKDHDIQTVLVTLGAKGCFVYTRGGERHIESAPSSGGDTIGAGDAFSAAFLYAYLSGKDAFTAAHCGNVLGAFVAANTGALPAFSRTVTHTLHSIIDGEETSWRKEFSESEKNI